MSKNKQPSVPLVRSGQEFSNVDKEKKPKVHNNLLKEYFRRPEIFADFVNLLLNARRVALRSLGQFPDPWVVCYK